MSLIRPETADQFLDSVFINHEIYSNCPLHSLSCLIKLRVFTLNHLYTDEMSLLLLFFVYFISPRRVYNVQ